MKGRTVKDKSKKEVRPTVCGIDTSFSLWHNTPTTWIPREPATIYDSEAISPALRARDYRGGFHDKSK